MYACTEAAIVECFQGSSGICVTVTLTDGLAVARSVFHTSINYRSVTIFGQPRAVTDADEKRAALDAIVEHIIPGRNAEARSLPQAIALGTI